MSQPQEPILVIAYNDSSRNVLAAEIEKNNLRATPCSSFAEAEEMALHSCYSGLLIDLPAIVKAKGEEKIIACTLASFFPTLRVRIIGSMLVPMTLAGDARQDNNLQDFLEKTCSRFTPRKLRLYRRRPLCISTLLGESGTEQRGYTLDLSWGGAFVSDTSPERFLAGEQHDLVLHEFSVKVPVTIRWIRPWGERFAPGIGVSFNQLDKNLEQILRLLLKTSPELDRDRLSS